MSLTNEKQTENGEEKGVVGSLSRITTLKLLDPKTLKPWSLGLSAYLKGNNLDEVTGLSPLYPCLKKHEKRYESIITSEKGKAQINTLSARQQTLLGLTADAIESKMLTEQKEGVRTRSEGKTEEEKTEEEKKAERVEQERKNTEHVRKLERDRTRLKRATAAILATVDDAAKELLSDTVPHPQIMWETLWDTLDHTSEFHQAEAMKEWERTSYKVHGADLGARRLQVLIEDKVRQVNCLEKGMKLGEQEKIFRLKRYFPPEYQNKIEDLPSTDSFYTMVEKIHKWEKETNKLEQIRSKAEYKQFLVSALEKGKEKGKKEKESEEAKKFAFSANDVSKAVCRKFQEGKCTRGNKCSYLHVNLKGTQPTNKDIPKKGEEKKGERPKPDKKGRGEVICYNCDKPGHIGRHCPLPDRRKQNAGANTAGLVGSGMQPSQPAPAPAAAPAPHTLHFAAPPEPKAQNTVVPPLAPLQQRPRANAQRTATGAQQNAQNAGPPQFYAPYPYAPYPYAPYPHQWQQQPPAQQAQGRQPQHFG